MERDEGRERISPVGRNDVRVREEKGFLPAPALSEVECGRNDVRARDGSFPVISNRCIEPVERDESGPFPVISKKRSD